MLPGSALRPGLRGRRAQSRSAAGEDDGQPQCAAAHGDPGRAPDTRWPAAL